MLYARIAAGLYPLTSDWASPCHSVRRSAAQAQCGQPSNHGRRRTGSRKRRPDGMPKKTRRRFYQVLEQYPPGRGLGVATGSDAVHQPGLPGVVSERCGVRGAVIPTSRSNPGYYLETVQSEFLHPRSQYDADSAGDRGCGTTRMQFLGALRGCRRDRVRPLQLPQVRRRIPAVDIGLRRQNAEVHNKILDRFTSNEELLAYIDRSGRPAVPRSDPDRRRAAPPERSIGAPFGGFCGRCRLGILP